jgi:hypothetical protein
MDTMLCGCSHIIRLLSITTSTPGYAGCLPLLVKQIESRRLLAKYKLQHCTSHPRGLTLHQKPPALCVDPASVVQSGSALSFVAAAVPSALAAVIPPGLLTALTGGCACVATAAAAGLAAERCQLQQLLLLGWGS